MDIFWASLGLIISLMGKLHFSSEVERLRTSPSPEAPRTNAPKPIPYDEMILRLLETIANVAQESAGSDEGNWKSCWKSDSISM
jgi:hypothetical protein